MSIETLTPTNRRGIGAHESPKSETSVWLTPPAVLEALGPFDLDPCACCEPRPWPTAARHYTKAENGLSRPWVGRVWLNPPYGPPAVVGPWLRRMVRHDRGTALLFARTETALFFETVWPAASAVLFLKGRLHFHRPDGSLPRSNNGSGKSGAPSVLIAYGAEDADRLRECGLAGQYVRLK